MTVFSKPNLELMEAREVPASLQLFQGFQLNMIVQPPTDETIVPPSPPPASPPTSPPIVVVILPPPSSPRGT